MARKKQASLSPSLRLYEQRGETSIFIDATITKSGDLKVSGQDVGKAPQTFWGDDDYEYWVQVPQAQKDQVLLTLLEQLYKGNPHAVEEFRTLLETKGIPCTFDTWI